MILAGTIEEKILELHATKRDLAESLLESSGFSARDQVAHSRMIRHIRRIKAGAVLCSQRFAARPVDVDRNHLRTLFTTALNGGGANAMRAARHNHNFIA